MTTDQTDSNGKAGGGGARAITRGDEARPILSHEKARDALAAALGIDVGNVYLTFANDPPYQLERIGIGSFADLMTPDQKAAAARAGIVPGAEGWCWAPAAPAVEPDTGDECIGCSHSRGSHDRSGGGCIYCNCPTFRAATAEKPHAYRVGCAACKAGASHVEEPKEPPAWLTAAVPAILPPDGTPMAHQAIVRALCVEREPFTGDDVTAALAHLVSTGEIEAVEGGTWRQWGVPEGWSDWTVDDDGASNIACLANPHIAARAYRDGEWKVWDGQSSSPQWQGRAKPGRLANAKRTALQTCHAMLASMASRQSTAPGVEGAPVRIMRDALIAGLASPAPAAPVPTRAEQVRHALLAVLTRGAVVGVANVLTALDGEGVQPAADGREAREAAREFGASVDGARWSLPAMPPGWGWVRALTHALYLAPHGSDNAIADSIANISARDSLWTVTEPGADWKAIERGEGVDDADAIQQALAAARRAGLFARPAPAVEVTSDGGPAVLPAVTSQRGEAVVKVATAPLPSGQALASHIERMVGIREGQSDCSLARLIEAFAVGVEERVRASVEALTSPRVTIEGPTLRVYGDDGRTVVSEERMALDYAAERMLSESLRVQLDAAETERNDARAQMAIEAERANKAEQERDAARAKLAALGAEIDALHARWSGAA